MKQYMALLSVAAVATVSFACRADVSGCTSPECSLPGFVLELFDGKTGTVAIASGEFAAPGVTRTDGRIRIFWKGHPRLGERFTATVEGVEGNGAAEWTFSCAGNESGLPLGRIAFPVVDVPCADNGHLLYSPDAGGGTMGWKRRVDWKSLPSGRIVASTSGSANRAFGVHAEAKAEVTTDIRRFGL